MPTRRLAAPALCAALAFATGCSSEDINPAGGAPEPTVPQLAEGWNEFLPGGETICSRGTDYAYWVHPGTVNRVVIDFIGGGACWNELTCSVADAIFQPDVEQVREAVATNALDGIYDKTNTQNPFKDWFHVVVPYCTGDVHWGDAVRTYGEGEGAVTINHKGAVNSRAVLDWVYDNFSAPEHVLVTGCSAGSYGSAMWAPHVMNHYQGSAVTQFGDSGAGIITQEFFQESFPSWNAEQAFPSFIPALDPAQVDILDTALPDLYAGVGNYFGEQRVSQYNTAFDENQTFYYTAMGATDGAEGWSQKMYASIDETEQRADNFQSFIASGEQHCILLYDNFYTVNAGGGLLTDWRQGMVDRATPVSPRCTDCQAPTP
ncbi:MAG: pectin acetylesterase-family hydrolase [Polyangiaceae bacterium]